MIEQFKSFVNKLSDRDPELVHIVLEAFDTVFYHGTPDNLQGKNGIHVGTKKAATQALEARIGVPVEGSWDGTREYGKTLLAGRKRLAEISKERGYGVKTGHNCGSDIPEDNYYPGDRKTRATYSDLTEVPLTARPVVFPTKISGKMSNTPHRPTSDSAANRMMSRYTKSGNAKQGYFYKNDAEDCGSISAVVPNESFLLRESADGSPSLAQRIEALKPEIAKIGQKEYDEWAAAESREDFADVYAGGGICHFIADEVAEFIDKAIPGVEALAVSSDFEQHVYVVVRSSDSVPEYNEDDESEDESSFDMVVVDIHWSVYETGGGFTWKRIPDIEITADDVSVHSQSCTAQNWKYLTGG